MNRYVNAAIAGTIAGIILVMAASCSWLQGKDPKAAEYVLSAEECMRQYADAADEARLCVRAARARLHPEAGP